MRNLFIFILWLSAGLLNAEEIPSLSASQNDIRAVLAQRREEFYETVEELLLPKIVQDVDEILRNGWADAVSPKDLFHVHLAISLAYPLDKTRSYPQIFNGRHLILLYHSHEYDDRMDDPNRNILSSLSQPPRVIPGSSKGTFKDKAGVERQFMTTNCTDLESWYVAQIDFGRTPEDRSAWISDFNKTLRFGDYYFGIFTDF
ncbi:MAG: hypothetical protein WCU88_03400 [Elusimicrobiota bacterium]|jgi:hypothetical protein